jgi:hypothetical protein
VPAPPNQSTGLEARKNLDLAMCLSETLAEFAH